MKLEIINDIKKLIRDIPDFPKPGIIFKDITPLLLEQEKFSQMIDLLADNYKDKDIDKIVAIEARGFILGSVLAYKLGVGLIPVRKAGKLPGEVLKTTYELEYGTDTLEIHADAIKPEDKLLIIDDVLATGGTVAGVVNLLHKLGANIQGIGFLIELEFLKGREKLVDQPIFSLLKY